MRPWEGEGRRALLSRDSPNLVSVVENYSCPEKVTFERDLKEGDLMPKTPGRENQQAEAQRQEERAFEEEGQWTWMREGKGKWLSTELRKWAESRGDTEDWVITA